MQKVIFPLLLTCANFRRFICNSSICRKIVEGYWVVLLHDNDNNSMCLGHFKLCNMWISDTSYYKKRLLSSRTWKNPVHLGPVKMHFTKDEEIFRRFCVGLISSNPQLINLKKVRVDIDVEVFNGFQSVICRLLQLCYTQHL